MKALVRDAYGPPDVLRVDEVDDPQPTDDQVLVEVEAASLNTADLDHLLGVPRIARVGTGIGRPKTRRMGLDVAGRVAAVGPEVKELSPGDRVWADLFQYGHGSLADYVCAPERAFSLRPVGVTAEQAATVPHSGILALQALVARGPIRAGDRVLINGAGGCVGPFAIQIARSMGAVVTAVDHTDKVDMLEALGADRVVDYTSEDVTRHPNRYDLIVDIAATRSVLRFRRSLALGGRYILIARSLGGFFGAAVLGGLVSLFGRKRMGVFGWVPNRRRDLEILGRLIADGQVNPLIDRRYSLDDAPAAFRYLADGAARGKLVVVPGPVG